MCSFPYGSRLIQQMTWWTRCLHCSSSSHLVMLLWRKLKAVRTSTTDPSSPLQICFLLCHLIRTASLHLPILPVLLLFPPFSPTLIHSSNKTFWICFPLPLPRRRILILQSFIRSSLSLLLSLSWWFHISSHHKSFGFIPLFPDYSGGNSTAGSDCRWVPKVLVFILE